MSGIIALYFNQYIYNIYVHAFLHAVDMYINKLYMFMPLLRINFLLQKNN
jgi:hypothetical protein